MRIPLLGRFSISDENPELIPVDRSIAFEMVTSRYEGEEPSLQRFFWMTRGPIGQRLGWEELGLKPGPSYWCMMQ